MKTECSICGKKAEIKLEATIVVSTVSGVLKKREEIDTLYVCGNDDCELAAAKRLKKVAKGML